MSDALPVLATSGGPGRPQPGLRLREGLVLVGEEAPGRWTARQTSLARSVGVYFEPVDASGDGWEASRGMLMVGQPALPALLDAGTHPVVGRWMAAVTGDGEPVLDIVSGPQAVRVALELCRLQATVVDAVGAAVRLRPEELRYRDEGGGRPQVFIDGLPEPACGVAAGAPRTWFPDCVAEAGDRCPWRAAALEVVTVLRAVLDLDGAGEGDGRVVGLDTAALVDVLRSAGEHEDIDLLCLRRGLGRLLTGGSGDRRSTGTERSLVGRRYELLGPLGGGGMASVHRALDRITGRVVALKCLAGDGAELQARALQAEFRLLAGLDHAHVAEVLDYGEDEERGPYLVMELYERGVDLRAAAQELPVARRLELLAQLVRGVEYLHRQGVIHRDLKPANVVVIEGRVRILDLGISSGRGVPELAPGRVMGSRGYIAPEVLAGGRCTPAADMFAVGVLVHELLTGRHPYAEGTLRAVHIDGVRPALVSMVGALLARRPADRPAASDLLMVLEEQREGAVGGRAEDEGVRFAGREVELATLVRAVDRARRDVGSAWLVEGPSGIGKSRLSEELCTRARIHGTSVVVGQCADRGGPLEPLAPLARWLALMGEPTALALQVLATIDPELSWRLGRHVAPPPPLPPAAAATRLADTLLHELARVEQPLLLLIEDVHWASDVVRRLLQRIARLSGARRLVLVATARPADGGASVLDVPCQPLRLPPLSPRAVAEIGTSVLGAQGARDEVVSFLVRASEGNPFLAVETARDLARGLGEGDLPVDGAAGILRRRLAGLEADEQRCLALAALVGREVDRGLLHVAFTGAPVEAWLLRARQAAILEYRGERLRFAHDRLREELLARIDDADRVALCTQAADLLGKLRRPSRAVRQLALYDQAGDPRAAALAASVAGLEASAVGAHAQAVALLERAARERSDAPVAERVRWWWLAGESHYALGHGDEGVACCMQALRLAGHPLPGGALGRAWRIADDAWAVLWSRVSGPRAPTAVPAAVLSALGLIGADAYNRDDGATGLLVSLRALRLAEESHAWAAMARVAAGLQLGLGSLGFRRSSAWMGRLAAEIGPRAGDHPDRAMALVAAAFADASAARLGSAIAQAQAAETSFGRTGHARGRDEARLAGAWAMHLCGRLDAAVDGYRRLQKAAEARGDLQMLAWALHGVALVRLEQGDLDGTETALAALPQDAALPDPGVAAAIEAALCLARGQLRPAWDAAARTHRLLPRGRTVRGGLVQAEGLLVAVIDELCRRGSPELAHERALLHRMHRRRHRHLARLQRIFPWVAEWRERIGRHLRAGPRAQLPGDR